MTARKTRYLTVAELAEWLNLRPETVVWWRKQIPPRGPRHKKFGRSIRYPVHEVEAYEEDPQAYDHKRSLEVDF